MNKRDKRITSYFVLFSLLIVLGVAFAILQANLQINGIAKISENQWNVHFENIVVNPDSVPIGTGDTAATIDPQNNCKVDFEVTLSIPGDFYEFTVDAKNAGTIDAMIGTLEKTLKVNNVVTETIPDYLNYSVTYEDDTEILENHLLAKNTSETYKVRIEYRTDIDELPTGAQTISTYLEPIFIQADNGAVIVNHPQSLLDTIEENAVIDNIASTYVTNSNGVHFSDISSDTNGKGIYLRAGTENEPYPIYYYRGAVDNNHLLFANFCWRIVRTTNTGGVKLIYDGVQSNGECNNTGTATLISTLKTKFNPSYYTPASAGYMYYGDINSQTYSQGGANLYYGPDVTYANGTYTLTPKGNYNVEIKSTISGTNLDYHHYTCGSRTAITCTTVRYVYYVEDSQPFYIELSNGKKIEDALSDMFSNTTDSTIKGVIDTWYQTNMTSYTSYLEDTIYCNDRSIDTLNGWDPDGGDADTAYLYFGGYNRAKTYSPSLSCTKNDSFTVSESATGNGKLTYPVGLLTVDEVMLAGGKVNTNNKSYYLNNGTDYWLGSPSMHYSSYNNGAYGFNVYSGHLYGADHVNYSNGVRAVVSLKLGTQISGGTGTSSDPYIVE